MAQLAVEPTSRTNIIDVAMQIAQLGAKVGKSTATNNGIYGFVGKDGRTEFILGDCHYRVMAQEWGKVKDPVAVVTRIHRVGNRSESLSDDVCKDWYHYLFNDSPYAPWVITKDVEEAWEKKYCAISTEAPANMVQSFCIATRNTWENASRVQSVVKLLRAGIHPNIAFVVGYHIVPDTSDMNGDVFSLSVPHGNHQVFDNSVHTEGAIAFQNGESLYPLKPYYEQQVIGGTVSRQWWGEGTNLKDFLKNVFESLGSADTSYKNPFAKAKIANNSTTSFKMSMLVAHIKADQEGFFSNA